MRAMVLVVVVLLFVSVVDAAPIYHSQGGTLTDPANNVTDPGGYFLPPGVAPGYVSPWYRYFFQDWGWDHAVTYPGDPSPDQSGAFSLLSATLTIDAWGARDDNPDDPTFIYADGIFLGQLVSAGYNTWTTTVFNLQDIIGNLDLLNDGVLNVYMDIDTTITGVGVIILDAQLDVAYQWDWVEYPVVPVPGAVALAGIGACLVRWTRRRRYL